MITRALRAAAAGASTFVGGGGGGTPGSTDFIFANAGANINDGGGGAWTNPGNITASDGARASATGSATGPTEILYATFDLSTVPDGAAITGVIVRIERSYSSASAPQSVRDHTVQLTKDGANMVGGNKADTTTDWPLGSDANADYGGSADLWGTSLTAAEVKAASFGVMIKADHVTVGATNNAARIDAVWINVHYEE